MPDVGLTTASEPLDPKIPVIIRYSVEVGGPQVYNESYDVKTLREELREDESKVVALWARRLKCVVQCLERPGFSSSVTRCLVDGKACDYGFHEKGALKVDEQGIP